MNRLLQSLLFRHVGGHVTVQEPAAWAIGRPHDRSGFAWIEVLGHDVRNLVDRISVVAVLIAEAGHFKKETVEMHGVIVDAGVQQAPAGGVAHAVGELF